jgi:hypothetical protein
MPQQQGVGGAELGQYIVVSHGKVGLHVQKGGGPGSARLRRHGSASRKIVLEMLEASGKRVYSAREIQSVRQGPERVSGNCEG